MSVSSVISNIASTLASAYSDYQASQTSTTSSESTSTSSYGAATNVTLSPGATASADELDFSASKDSVTLLLGYTDTSGVDGKYKNKAAGGYDAAEGAQVSGVTVVTTTSEKDKVFGGSADEDVSLGAGNDTFDTYTTNSGNDVVDGGAGNDTIYTGDGNDVLIGGTGDDLLVGENGDDAVYGGAGDDYIDAGDGNDFIDGGAGDDDIASGDGNDTILISSGNDKVSAGSGDDTIVVSGGSGGTIKGGSGNDTLELEGTSSDYTVDIRDSKAVITRNDGSDFKLKLENVENIIFKGDVKATEPAPIEIKPPVSADDTKSDPYKTSASLVFGGVDSAAVRNVMREFAAGAAKVTDAGSKPVDIKEQQKPQSQAPAQTGEETPLEPAAQNILAQAIGQLAPTVQTELARKSYTETDRLAEALNIKGARATANPIEKLEAQPVIQQTRENDISKPALQDKSVTSAKPDTGIGSRADEKPALNSRPALAGKDDDKKASPLNDKPGVSGKDDDKKSPLEASRADKKDEAKKATSASDKDVDGDIDKPGAADKDADTRLRAFRAYSSAA